MKMLYRPLFENTMLSENQDKAQCFCQGTAFFQVLEALGTLFILQRLLDTPGSSFTLYKNEGVKSTPPNKVCLMVCVFLFLKEGGGEGGRGAGGLGGFEGVLGNKKASPIWFRPPEKIHQHRPQIAPQATPSQNSTCAKIPKQQPPASCCNLAKPHLAITKPPKISTCTSAPSCMPLRVPPSIWQIRARDPSPPKQPPQHPKLTPNSAPQQHSQSTWSHHRQHLATRHLKPNPQ